MPLAKRNAADAEQRAVTRRVVLQKVRVVVVPDGFDASRLAGTEADAAKALAELVGGGKGKRGQVGEAWVECGEFTGSKTQAIEAFAGKPGTPDATVGEFKAVPVRGFQGGAIYRQPALPLVEREVIR